MDLTTKKLRDMMVSNGERNLIELLRDIKYGKVVVYLKDGQPVRADESIKTIQL